MGHDRTGEPVGDGLTCARQDSNLPANSDFLAPRTAPGTAPFALAWSRLSWFGQFFRPLNRDRSAARQAYSPRGMKRILLGFVLGAALLGVATDQRAAGSPETRAQARTVDRTLVCTTGIRAGVREIEIYATSGVRDAENRNRWKSLASLDLRTTGSSPTISGIQLAGASAGRGGLSTPPGVGFAGSVSYSPARCKATRARVRLSSVRLSGGAASPWGDRFDCVTQRRVLVHVRGSFRAPTRFKGHRSGLLIASGGVQEAQIAVRTEGGRPLVYGTVSESGKARLFTAAGCVPD